MKILIIGSAGYIGSYLYKTLSLLYNVTGCDILESPFTDIRKYGRDLSLDELSQYDTVIYLAGFTGRTICMKYEYSRSYEENVIDIRTVAQKLTSSQVLLYASSASILEGYLSPVKENVVINETLLDKYAQSMYTRELEIKQLSVRSIGFRFGTVIGISPSQRTDLVHIVMVRSALQTGMISVFNSTCLRGILGITDLANSFISVLSQLNVIEGASVYNLCSINTSIEEIAQEVSKQTGAIVLYNTSTEKGDIGFNLNYNAIIEKFGITCNETNSSLVTLLINYFSKTNTPCRICKKDMTLVLDLGKQPLANNYVSEPCEQNIYPLILTRCRECYHTQQDFTVPPDQMFSTYQYMSGTSKTLCQYFSWLSDHIIKSYPTINRKRIVMELACNDGSQLDEFKKRGWDTIGVDPAQNIGEIAKSKGHDIHVAFWGSDKVLINTLPDVIIAQNVLAHVPDPLLFMKACHNYMATHSSLYIQTSQCNMYENGEFDTIYHEHLSFFTASSMKRLAKEAGLIITHVEKTPIHGTSYLFTMKRSDAEDYLDVDSTLDELILYETPFYQDSFFNTYKQRIYNIQNWVQKISKEFIEKDYTLIAFGAAAKGMTLLNFFNINQYITYIVDDAYMKQGKYTPNSNIIIRHPSVLKDDTRNLAVIMLAWNFMDEISQKISEWRQHKNTVLIVPYPQQIIRYLF